MRPSPATPRPQSYLQAYLDLIRGVAPAVNAWPEVPQLDRGLFEELPRVNVSVKLTALDSQFDAIDQEGTARRVKDRLRELLRTACEHRAFVNIDMESYREKDLTLEIFKQILMEDEFRQTTDVGIVIQAYLRDSAEDLHALRDWALRRETPIWVRLVKGAYWDHETIRAQATGWPVPVFQQKWESDANFERLSRFLLRSHQALRPALASHNLRSLAQGMAVAQHIGLPQTGFELQMLYGMADAAKQVFVDMGYRLRIYMPYGELIPGMAYLVRRLLENTSNDSFLRASFAENVAVEKLLMNPLDHAAEPHGSTPAGNQPPSHWTHKIAYANEPPIDFAVESNRRAMHDALGDVRTELGRFYPLWIDGQPVGTAGRIVSVNPSHKRQTVGETASAESIDADRAVEAAHRAWPAWAARPATERAEFLRRAAAAMRRRHFELAAWEVYECGKGWREADADVCEAIDFCEYYALGAESMAQSARGRRARRGEPF